MQIGGAASEDAIVDLIGDVMKLIFVVHVPGLQLHPTDKNKHPKEELVSEVQSYSNTH